MIDLDLDTLIERWRSLNARLDFPWVLYEHGTCVCLPRPGGDLLAQADALLSEWRVEAGTATAVSAMKPTRGGGWLVTCAQPWISTFVPAVAAAAAAGEAESAAAATAVVQWGRSLRDRDARELGVVHVEDCRFDRDHRAVAGAEAWGRLVRAAADARRQGSDWGRFGLPLSALSPLTAAEASADPPKLATLALEAEVLAMSDTLEALTACAETALRPFTLYAGLTGGTSALDAAALSERHPPGSFLALTGFLSTSGRVRPPIYAARRSGALLVVKVRRAAPLPKPGDGPDEYEFLLPRDCRCRVTEIVAAGRFESSTSGRDAWLRPVLRLEQVLPDAV